MNDVLLPPPMERNNLRSETISRKKEFEEKRVAISDLEEEISAGWELEKSNWKKAKVTKRKSLDERLESRFWRALYKLGYSELNSGRNFEINIGRKNEPAIYKKIDVFAKDDETIVIAECMTCKVPKKRSLHKDISEFAAIRSSIANSIRQHCGTSFKPKIIWFFVTVNIIWSKPDFERARQENIQVMCESEFRYFSQIIDRLGPAAKPQFLAEYLKGISIPEMENIKLPAIKAHLAGTNFTHL